MITIVDYGAGNLRSVTHALHAIGHASHVTAEPRAVANAAALIFPGVGSANEAMRQLQRLDLVEPIRAFVRSGKPFLGVCLGLQLLFTESEEYGGQPCLDLLPGAVRRLPEGVKVPHMGWNSVRLRYQHALLEGIPNETHFYFVHSYYVEPRDPSVILGETAYGLSFPSIISAENVLATQFHPEKSARLGLRIYENFARWATAPAGAEEAMASASSVENG